MTCRRAGWVTLAGIERAPIAAPRMTARHDMSDPSEKNITVLLDRARAGDADALEKLMPQVYHELRALAHRHLQREPAGHTLSTTALVHEAYLRLSHGDASWPDRRHFFAYAATLMRNILVDYARRRGSEKRGGGVIAVELDDADARVDALAADVVALDAALIQLEQAEPDLARLVEMRFFAGMSLDEIGDIMGRSLRSLDRDWRKARAFLHQAMV